MTGDSTITLQVFHSKAEAESLIAFLKEHKIESEIENASPPVDLTFTGNTLQNEFRVKIREQDFENANAILEQEAKQVAYQLPDDHYLYEFRDEELFEILEKPDEWGKADYQLSQQILIDRGYEITEQRIRQLRKDRVRVLAEPEKGHTGWLIFGFISAIFGGLLGIFIGWFHWTFKKTLPTGKRVYAYDERTRKTGRIMFWVGVGFLVGLAIRWIWKYGVDR